MLTAETAKTVYKAFEDFFVNGMSCDRVSAVTESSAEKVIWKMTKDIHAQYWNGDSSSYHAIWKSVMEGMLSETNFTLASTDDAHYSIISK